MDRGKCNHHSAGGVRKLISVMALKKIPCAGSWTFLILITTMLLSVIGAAKGRSSPQIFVNAKAPILFLIIIKMLG